MRQLVVLLLLWLFASCAGSKRLKTDKDTGLPVARKMKQLDTVQEGLLRGRGNVLFHVSNAVALPDDDEDVAEADCKSKPKDCNSPLFLGSDRRAAKLSFNKTVQNKPEPLEHLVTRLIKTDKAMHNHMPAISLACNSTRVKEEMENVFLDHVFVYLILRESDGDYHVIVGNGKDSTSDKLMSIEISGLPETSSTYYSKLKEVRDKFEAKYKACSNKILWDTRKKKALPEISVKGTLFYDMRHSNTPDKHSGSGNIKTGTFWEIHPATYIKFWN